MPITSFTVAGAEVNPLLESLDIRETVGGVSTLSCDITSVGSPVQRFDVFDAVAVEEDGVVIFSGTVTQTREQGFGGPNIYDTGGNPQIVTTITAEDQNRIAERISVTETVAAGTTLKAFLTTLVDDYLDTFSVTLHASQVDGPALPAMSFDKSKASEVLQALTDATGYLWRIDYDKALRMWAAGDLAAPFDISEYDDPPRWTGDVQVETILGDNYANRIVVISDPLEEEQHVESFTGDDVTSTFNLEWTLIKSYGIIHRYEADGVTPSGGETFGIPPDAPLQWSYDAATNSITREIGPTEAPYIYKLTFHGTFQAEATAQDAAEIAAHGLYEEVIQQSNITTVAAAQDLADAILAERLNSGEQLLTYETRYSAPTLRAGQAQTITATARDVSGSYIIRDLRIRAEVPVTADFAASGLGLIRTITAKAEEVMVGKWQHTYRDWLRFGKGGGVTTVGTGGAVSVGAAPPVESVQFNRLGAFGGSANFTYDEDTSTVMLGTNHTPGGAGNLLVGTGHTVT